MVYFKSHLGFGNQLFNYVFARCVAEHFGYKLQHHSHDGCEEIRSGNQFFLPKYFDLDFNANGKVIEGEPVSYTTRQMLKMSDIDGSRPILLEGWYERYDQIKDFKSLIATQWLRFKEPNTYQFAPSELALHVRLGEKTELPQRTLTQAYYADAIHAIEHSRLYWFTDSPDSAFVRKLHEKFGGTILYNSFIEDFKMMMSFKKLVTSSSTYSFWAAWLGNADEIVAPKRGQTCYLGRWTKDVYSDCDYWPAESRYIYLAKPAWMELCARTLLFAYRKMMRLRNFKGG